MDVLAFWNFVANFFDRLNVFIYFTFSLISSLLYEELCTLVKCKRMSTLVPQRVSNLLTSLGHTGRGTLLMGHTLNAQTLTKTDEQEKGFK